jgi:hypothetical protein
MLMAGERDLGRKAHSRPRRIGAPIGVLGEGLGAFSIASASVPYEQDKETVYKRTQF